MADSGESHFDHPSTVQKRICFRTPEPLSDEGETDENVEKEIVCRSNPIV